MSRSGRALLSVLALVGSTLAGAADAAAHPGGPELPLPILPEPSAPPTLPAPPAVTVSSTVDSGPLPLTVTFDAVSDGEVLGWDFTGDGVFDAQGSTTSWTFTTPGQHVARVTVTDGYGAVATGELPVVAGNTRPTVVIESPADGGVSEPGERLSFRLTVTDPEDGVVDCTKVVMTHGSQTAAPGPDCTGVLTREVGQTFSAQYADGGVAGVPALTGSAEVVLNPRAYEAPELSLPHINLAGVNHLAVEFAPWQGGDLTVHADSPAGPVVASFANVPADARWLAADVLDPGGARDLYFVGNVSVKSVRFQTVPAVTVAPTDGWHRTDVPVSVGTAPLWEPQVSLDGGVTWVPAPVVLSADGVHDVRYRAVDAAGRTSEPAATTVRIDRTAPAVALPAREFAHLGTLTTTATDAGSGLAAVAATLDGVPTPVELWRFPSGVHQLTVTATDAAGNTSTHTTEIEITTTLAELTPLLALRGVPFVKALVMRLQLMAAGQAVEAGRDDQAVAWLRAFLRSAGQLRDPAARDTLTADATFVITQLNRG